MIKKGLLDFLKCMKYYLVPFGILSIFSLIGLRMGLTALSSTIKHFFDQAAEIASQAKIDGPGIWNAFLSHLLAVDFSDLGQALKTIFSIDWFKSTLADMAKAFFGDSISMEQITELLQQTVVGIVMSFVAFMVMILLGILVGIFLLRFLIRKEMTHVKTGKALIFCLADTGMWLVLILLVVLLGRVASWLGTTILIIGIISLPFLCLCEGYLFYGIKKIPFGQAAHIKNILLIYLLELIILAITAAFTAIVFLLFKGLLSFYLALPIVEIGVIAISLTAENYIVNFIAKNQEETPPELKEAN